MSHVLSFALGAITGIVVYVLVLCPWLDERARKRDTMSNKWRHRQ